jgi:GNAT superfamily N-acetyltransferase
MTITTATPGQIPQMARLFETQLREHGNSASPDEIVVVLHKILDEPGFGFLLVAEAAACEQGSAGDFGRASSGETVVGVAYAACILSLEHGGWSGWLEELYVLSEWRERGVGTQLLDAVIAGARERNWLALDLEVDAEHRRVISLYARRDFQPLPRTRYVRRLSSTAT